MISLKKKASSGFTIVELLIVIVVIGILAALVVTTYNGIQQKARDTERKTDVNAMHGQLEAYQAQNGKYPTLANLVDATFRSANMKGLDAAALTAPNGTVLDSAAATISKYSYVPAPAACDNTSGNECTSYTLTADLEQSGAADYVKASSN
jgi:prepilin-type N-terminal cleavage/methylation domain-containing protein